MLDLGTSFLAAVERDPQALAIVDGDVRLTYAEWFKRISALTAGLSEIGLRPGDHLLTALQNHWENATLHWACQFAGIIITPINWRAKENEIDFCVEDAEARAILYEDVSTEAVHAASLTANLPRFMIRSSVIADMLSASAPDAVPLADAEDWSLMLYTSGTTSKPKGVPRRHRAERAATIAHVAQNLYRHRERTLGVMPLYHTMGLRALLAMSVVGGTFVCLPRANVEQVIEPDRTRAHHQSLSGADAVPRHRRPPAFC